MCMAYQLPLRGIAIYFSVGGGKVVFSAMKLPELQLFVFVLGRAREVSQR